MLGGGGGGVNVCDPTTFWNVPRNSPAGLALVLITMYAVLFLIVATMLAAWLTLKIHLSEPSGCRSPWLRPTGTSYRIWSPGASTVSSVSVPARFERLYFKIAYVSSP